MATRSVQADTRTLDALRISHGWTVEEFAARADLSKRGLENIMAGKPMLVATAKRLASKLDVPVQSILVDYTSGLMQTAPGFGVHVRLAIDFEDFDESTDGVVLVEALGGDAIHAAPQGKGRTTVTIEMTEEAIRTMAERFPQLNVGKHGILSALGILFGWGTSQLANTPANYSIINSIEAIQLPDSDDFPIPELRGKTLR